MNKDLSALKSGDKKRRKGKKKQASWIIIITILSFIISFIFSFVSESLMPGVNIGVGILLVLVFILIGVIFDMIGLAVASADEAPFHSMASQKIKGAPMAVRFIKNASKVSSFCNDVIGDICGIISGSAGIAIAGKIASALSFNQIVTTLTVTAIIASLTIGGKACGKSLAINQSNMILYRVTNILSILKK